MKNGLSLDIVGDGVTLDAMAGEWQELAARCADEVGFCRQPFVTQSWLRHRDDPRNRLHVISVRRERELVAVVPLMKRRDGFGTSVLKWLDSKTPLYDDILCAKEVNRKDLSGLIGEHLCSLPLVRKLKADWVLAGSPADRLLVDLGAQAERCAHSYLALLGEFRDWDAYFAARSPNTRQAYRRLHRRLAEQGEIRVERITDPDGLREAIGRIFERKRQWVLDRYGATNWLSPPETETYFQATARALSVSGSAFVLSLTCDGVPISTLLSYRSGQTIYLSKVAYDPAWNKYSPGWLLNLEAVKAAFAAGATKLDLMLGDEPWKERSADEVRPVRKYRLPLPVLGLRLPQGLRGSGRRGRNAPVRAKE